MSKKKSSKQKWKKKEKSLRSYRTRKHQENEKKNKEKFFKRIREKTDNHRLEVVMSIRNERKETEKKNGKKTRIDKNSAESQIPSLTYGVLLKMPDSFVYGHCFAVIEFESS